MRFLSLLVFALMTSLVTAQDAVAEDVPQKDTVEKLINQLVEVADPGFGYSSYFSGTQFLPYKNTGEMGTFVVGATRRARSETLRKIVEQGVEAVPALIKHLSDKRTTKMKPLSGMMWMDFRDEYDFNRRRKKKLPKGVNRELGAGLKDPDRHSVTVGDLCFVALGQIVNRNFSATRYQPTGGLVVSSPTYSKRLHDVVVTDWKGLTRAKHKQMLIEDFQKPDHEYRRIGAYLRLAFYYPEAVEDVVLNVLSQPTFDVFAIETLCRDKLYKTSDEKRRKQLFDDFLSRHGKHFAIGIENQLFDDLEMLEAHEEGRVSPPLTEYSTQPRELLIQLFDKPANVKSSQREVIETSSESERARLIRVLTHDKSRKIAVAVKKIFAKYADDDYMGPACLACLSNRGETDMLVQQLDRADLGTFETSSLYVELIRAVGSSQAKQVKDKLVHIMKTTVNDDYFMVALDGVKNPDPKLVLEQARRIVAGLPKETTHGQQLLSLIANQYPKQAKPIFEQFLSAGSANRAETMCVALWYGHPLAKELLAPLLDDRRKLPGFTVPTRVCDRAAQAISHTTKKITFDSDWSTKKKDAVIHQLKAYCKESG